MGGTISSWPPATIMPDEGQGARKLKSYMFAGGATDRKPRISGRRIKSCIPIHAPKLKPAIHVVCASGWIDWTQSSADAASLSSPMPLSKVPWLRPTPRKLKRSTAKPRATKLLYIACRSEEHKSELQSLMRNSYAVFCLKKKT